MHFRFWTKRKEGDALNRRIRHLEKKASKTEKAEAAEAAEPKPDKAMEDNLLVKRIEALEKSQERTGWAMDGLCGRLTKIERNQRSPPAEIRDYEESRAAWGPENWRPEPEMYSSTPDSGRTRRHPASSSSQSWILPHSFKKPRGTAGDRTALDSEHLSLRRIEGYAQSQTPKSNTPSGHASSSTAEE